MWPQAGARESLTCFATLTAAGSFKVDAGGGAGPEATSPQRSHDNPSPVRPTCLPRASRRGQARVRGLRSHLRGPLSGRQLLVGVPPGRVPQASAMSASTLQTIGVVFQILGVGVLIGGMVKSRRDLGLPPTRFGRAITRARQTVVRALARGQSGAHRGSTSSSAGSRSFHAKRSSEGPSTALPSSLRRSKSTSSSTMPHPKPFEWHSSADEILGRVKHCKEALGTGH